MIREILKYNDPMLRKATTPFDFKTDDAQELFEALRDTMCHSKHIGLAAPQINVSKSVIVVGDPTDIDHVIGMFNPKIVDFIRMDDSPAEIYYEEGCASWPGLFVKIKRSTGIRLRWSNVDGDTTTTKYAGLTARVVQHEIDHLNGVLFLDRATRYHRERGKKALKKIMRQRRRDAKNAAAGIAVTRAAPGPGVM